ncbi:hypothetical protein V5N11_015056 [Cardamine amara subsp. amara]|uniref:DUF7787 domain-containing protein n=1 Tax=Cardamine amara subsp. amara TaxID=228776 RepID=A0ABD1A6B3_CARAN
MRKYGEEKKMTLEEYVDFFSSGKTVDFTISYLNQILHMHGFRKLHKSHKKIVGEAVDAVDLLDPCRSTLKQPGVSSSSSSLTLDEVITDIEALKWQECCVTSLQIINSDQVPRSVPKPKPRSYKRKKSADENDTTMISLPALPRKMRTKKTTKKKNVKSITSLIEAAPKPLSDHNFPSRFTTIP